MDYLLLLSLPWEPIYRQKKIEESDPAHRSDQTAHGIEADPEMCRTAAADATSSPPVQLHICKFCGQGFPTRRELFRHLEVCEAVPEERRHPSVQVLPHKGRPPEGSPKKKAAKAKTSPEKKKVKFDSPNESTSEFNVFIFRFRFGGNK